MLAVMLYYLCVLADLFNPAMAHSKHFFAILPCISSLYNGPISDWHITAPRSIIPSV
jgi:hypothetical protein